MSIMQECTHLVYVCMQALFCVLCMIVYLFSYSEKIFTQVFSSKLVLNNVRNALEFLDFQALLTFRAVHCSDIL